MTTYIFKFNDTFMKIPAACLFDARWYFRMRNPNINMNSVNVFIKGLILREEVK
jgi:hypothetical protein